MSNEILTVEELNSAKMIREEIELEKTRLESLRACSAGFNFEINADKVQSQTLESKTEKFAVLIVEAENNLKKLESKLVEVSAELANKISLTFSRNALFVAVLIQHYCGGLNFTAIAAKIGYTRDYVWKLHKRAIATLSATKATA